MNWKNNKQITFCAAEKSYQMVKYNFKKFFEKLKCLQKTTSTVLVFQYGGSVSSEPAVRLERWQ